MSERQFTNCEVKLVADDICVGEHTQFQDERADENVLGLETPAGSNIPSEWYIYIHILHSFLIPWSNFQKFPKKLVLCMLYICTPLQKKMGRFEFLNRGQ